MPVQTSYSAEHAPGFEGQRATLALVNVVSKVAEGGDVPFGRAVVQGTLDEQGKLPSASGQVLLGITEMTTAWAETYGASGDLHVYNQYREMNIIDFGEVWVYTEQSVVPGDAVYYRHTADTAPLDVVGRFRKDASGGDADLIQGAKWTTTTSAGGLGKVKLNAPGTGILLAPDSSEIITAAGAGVVGIDTEITYIDSTLGVQALTLADGTAGQRKKIIMTADGGDSVVTPDNLLVGSTITLDDVGDTWEGIFDATSGAWITLDTPTATVA